MKQKITILLMLTILVFSGCWKTQPAVECQSDPSDTGTVHQTDPVAGETKPVFEAPGDISIPSESVLQSKDDSSIERVPAVTPGQVKNQFGENPDEKVGETNSQTKPSQSDQAEPKATEPSDPPENEPKETSSPEMQPPETEPNATEPPSAEQPETEPEPETTDPAVTEITYEFKRQVAAYAAQYINAYRGSPCTVLSGMSQVAQYRASQLTWNYGHSTADKRAALAAFEYGRYIDATEFGDDASNSYWEADSAEAICAGFYGTDPEAMGKKIADLIRNSSGHWSYISSSEYSYIGVGVEYREGSEYGWYACVMVGSVDYG